MEKIYDAIIIGARCAGAPTAMLLARKGYKVLLLDKAEFPSDTISTHIIFPPGVELMGHWGLLDEVIASNCPVIEKISFNPGPIKLNGTPPPIHDESRIIAPRRIILDQILIRHATGAGVEFRENCVAEEILMEGDRVTGVRCFTKGGKPVIEKAKMVIGADGRNSIVAKSVAAPKYNEQPSYTCWYYSYFSGPPVDQLRFFVLPDRALGMIPTNDGLVCIPQTCQAAGFRDFRSDIEGNYFKTFKMSAEISELMRGAKREDRFYGMSDLPNFFRKPYGPGWALAGDAAYHKDPLSGHGIMDAFISAHMLVNALDKGFTGKETMENSLEEYEKQRNNEFTAIYHFTCDFARMEPPPPEMMALFMALQSNQSATNRFLGMLAGTVRVEDFLSPENIGQVLATGERDTMQA